VIVADTGAILALLDGDERHHAVLRQRFEDDAGSWVLPWAILPEVDYLAVTRLGAEVEQAFLRDLAEGAFAVEWGNEQDLARAQELDQRHRALKLGLVDAVVIAMAERLEAEAIVTLDVRHFGGIAIRGEPKLWPRDL
jgi:predicted nucleic acid-binding protein